MQYTGHFKITKKENKQYNFFLMKKKLLSTALFVFLIIAIVVALMNYAAKQMSVQQSLLQGMLMGVVGMVLICAVSVASTVLKINTLYHAHGRPEAYEALRPEEGAQYDAMVEIDLDAVECMIALPFHPSNAYTIHEFNENAADILAGVEKAAQGGGLRLLDKLTPQGVQADQGVIAGCAGGIFDNLVEAADILRGRSTGNGGFSLSVYPASAPVGMELMRVGVSETLMESGAVLKPAFCGPCFGAGDVPHNSGLSIRHTTRNFPNREGAKPGEGQSAAVALMDARSIAASAARGGVITAASDVEYHSRPVEYRYDRHIYEKRCYWGFGKAVPDAQLVFGPNITDWPAIPPLGEHLLLELAAVIRDPVTTTDELIPSGETSSYRSNPLRLAEFTLSRREPAYVARAKRIGAGEAARGAGNAPEPLINALDRVGGAEKLLGKTRFGSCIFANKPGDGSAREQAASCQRVLGGLANVCYEYATKRYRSNCINWGIVPFTLDAGAEFPAEAGDLLFVPDVRAGIAAGRETFPATLLRADGTTAALTLHVNGLTPEERGILLAGCLMNDYAAKAR